MCENAPDSFPGNGRQSPGRLCSLCLCWWPRRASWGQAHAAPNCYANWVGYQLSLDRFPQQHKGGIELRSSVLVGLLQNCPGSQVWSCPWCIWEVTSGRISKGVESEGQGGRKVRQRGIKHGSCCGWGGNPQLWGASGEACGTRLCPPLPLMG